MSTNRRIFLDVDGVLNAVSDKNPSEWSEWRVTECDGWPIRHSLEMGRELGKIFLLPNVEVIWLTTWEHKANEWISPLFGWPKFRVAERVTPSLDFWWKEAAFRQIHEDNPMPFVWIDDDIDSVIPDVIDWFKKLDYHIDSFCIHPPCDKGLERHHLGILETWGRW